MDDTNKRGRKPAGPEYVQHLQGSAEAKQRLQRILETMTGRRRVLDVCLELGISESRFLQLREEFLQAALERLERKPAGRPRRTDSAAEADALRGKLDEVERALATAQLCEELALAGMASRPEPDAAEKKTPRRLKRQARRGWWKK
jgi:hypothetical protein